jgi:hypothetical protein
VLYCLRHTSTLFCPGYFEDGVSPTLSWDCPRTTILPISASQVAKITGMFCGFLVFFVFFFFGGTGVWTQVSGLLGRHCTIWDTHPQPFWALLFRQGLMFLPGWASHLNPPTYSPPHNWAHRSSHHHAQYIDIPVGLKPWSNLCFLNSWVRCKPLHQHLKILLGRKSGLPSKDEYRRGRKERKLRGKEGSMLHYTYEDSAVKPTKHWDHRVGWGGRVGI